MKTEHKPLVSLFSTKQIDEIPSRVQHKRVHTLEYDFSISHFPGKGMYRGDVLSRKLHSHDINVTNAESCLNEYEVLILEELLEPSERFYKINTELQRDPTTPRVVSHARSE